MMESLEPWLEVRGRELERQTDDGAQTMEAVG
jgi:hypothetical protein